MGGQGSEGGLRGARYRTGACPQDLHQFVSCGVGGGLSAIRGADFVENIGQMGADGSIAYEELTADLGVTLALGNESEHVNFALAEAVRKGRRSEWPLDWL